MNFQKPEWTPGWFPECMKPKNATQTGSDIDTLIINNGGDQNNTNNGNSGDTDNEGDQNNINNGNSGDTDNGNSENPNTDNGNSDNDGGSVVDAEKPGYVKSAWNWVSSIPGRLWDNKWKTLGAIVTAGVFYFSLPQDRRWGNEYAPTWMNVRLPLADKLDEYAEPVWTPVRGAITTGWHYTGGPVWSWISGVWPAKVVV